ncbi:MAG: hypothetical protein VX670_10490, partial [Candidatus Latescibacterota bacterium]|nr:hypothetical protein [Candidatus Latescibacterota bacterium]
MRLRGLSEPHHALFDDVVNAVMVPKAIGYRVCADRRSCSASGKERRLMTGTTSADPEYGAP